MEERVHDAGVRTTPATMDANELAQLLGVDRKTIYAAVERNQIPGVLRLGRLIKFARPIVLAWLGQGTPSEGKN